MKLVHWMLRELEYDWVYDEISNKNKHISVLKDFLSY